jgi:hypothetical protein
LHPSLVVAVRRILALINRYHRCCRQTDGCWLSLTTRIADTYRLWPATEISAWDWKPERTLRGTLFDYGFVLVVLASFFGVVICLAA